MSERFAVIGLGYVGLPVAMAFAQKFHGVVGFDADQGKIDALRAGRDCTAQFDTEELRTAKIAFTTDPAELRDRTFFIVSVPTPIDEHKRPDLRPLVSASQTVARVIGRGAVVVYESTVYPGVTEEVCAPIIAKISGLQAGVDFFLGYSPERINPGDREHTFERIKKVVAGDSPRTLERVAAAYGAVVTAGIHRAPSVKIAEAAKVIENTQRDLNIALMNELAMIFDRLGIATRDVLRAAGTKWNFMPFSPGLVGGHCIGVDPYYLTSKAEQLGYHPQVILAGRKINDGMGTFIAQKAVKLLVGQGAPIKGARVAILGLTFKENVPDVRNSRVPDIVKELKTFGIDILVHDPLADPGEAGREYGLSLAPLESLIRLDGLILAVPHREFLAAGAEFWSARLKPNGIFVDVKSAFDSAKFPPPFAYWQL
ncbi:MAG: nucleotide sugar dehydrogenase [Patescibacteria group bacterium]|nr:nucleotide sugar dehydrogenase [Patescibacteria group bacterium]